MSPSILLDRHVTEAAMRPPTTPSRHRWSRRHARASVASVVAAAPVIHRPAAIAAPVAPVAKRPANKPSRRPAPGAHLAASDRNRQLLFDDLDEILDGPANMPERWVPARSADQLDHASVMATIAEMRAEPLPTFDHAVTEVAPAAPTALRDAFDKPVSTWLPPSRMRSVPLDTVVDETPIPARLAAIGLVYAKRGTLVSL